MRRLSTVHVLVAVYLAAITLANLLVSWLGPAVAVANAFVFPLMAFGWPPLWPIVLGQLAAKTLGGLIWSLVLPAVVVRRKVAAHA